MTKKLTIPIISTALMLSMFFSPVVSAAGGMIGTAEAYGVKYKTHIQDIGWESEWKMDGSLSGTEGQSKRLEALKIELTGNVPKDAEILTYVHVQNEGDLGPFAMGKLAGTEGKGERLERIRLELDNFPGYVLKYNVQVQNEGWLRNENDDSTWYVSGETAGTEGKGLRLEGIRIKLVPVNQYLQLYYDALASVNQYQYTEDSWAAYQKVVKANAVTATSSNAQILAATRAVLAAQAALVQGRDMRAYYAVLEAVKEAECTPETWAEYQLVLDANIMTQDNTQEEIEQAITNILEAQKKLQRKVNLTAYLTALKSVRETDYTASSWAVYQQVLAENAMTEDNTQTEVDEATQLIIEAQRQMVRKFDFTAYDALLDAVTEEDYTAVSWTVYQKVVDKNVVTENDTQTDIETAIKNIEAAQKKLVLAGDLTEYEAVLNSVNKVDYTAASWATYKKVVTANEVSSRNTQQEIDAATANILAAQKKLAKAGDIEEYLATLAQVVKDNYTTASWATYQKVLAANEVTSASGQTAIDAAIEKILAAQKNLVPVGEMAEYLALLGAVSKADYTTASWTAYQKVVDANEVNRYSGQTAIDAAIAKIKAAQKSLVKRGDLSAYTAAIAAYVDKAGQYTSVSWAAYQKVLKANVMNVDKSQAAIDVATERIKAAQETLVKRGSIAALEAVIASRKEADYTPASWTVYQKVVDANSVSDDNPQSVIDAALAKIVAAQKKLVFRAETSLYNQYKALVETAQNNKEAYTKASWAIYKKVADANIMTPEKSSAEIEAAIRKIEDAQGELVIKGNTSIYDQEYHEFDGKDNEYTTAGWNAYQKVLDTKTNIMTVENSQAEIDAAVARIRTAQTKLVACKIPAELKYYYEAIADYANRKDEFTADSWRDYQLVISNNYVDKNSTAKAIISATTKILEAQKKLVSNADISQFLEAIKLYQENKRAGNAYAGHVTVASWNAYADMVETYASFNSSNNWAWNPYGSKNTDITQASGQTAVTSAANALNDTKADFVYLPEYAAAFVAYDAAMELPTGKTAESYTTTSFGVYSTQKALNTIAADDRIKTSLSVIEAKTDNMITARGKLVERAPQFIVDQFNGEIAIYETKLNTEMHWDSATGTYIIDDGYYTLASWQAYERVYKKYYIDQNTKLDPADDVENTFNTAIVALQNARTDLKITAKRAAAGLNQTDLQSPYVTTGTDLLTKARSFVTDPGFTVSIVSPVGIPNVGVNGSGVVTGAAGTTATISFKITENGNTSNAWIVTYYNIPIT